MKRGIDIGAGIGDHFDFSDLKCRAFRIMGHSVLPAHVVADYGPRQTGIGNHSVFDYMAKFNELGHKGCLYFFTAEALTWFQVSGVGCQFSEDRGRTTENR